MRESLTPQRRPRDRTSGLASAVQGWANLVLRLAIAAFIVSYGYYVWAIVGHYLQATEGVNPRIVNLLQLMGLVLVISGAAGTLALIYLTFEEVAWSVVAGILGGAVFFGTPFLIASYVHTGMVERLDVVRDYTAMTGEVMLFLVGLRIVWEVVEYLRQGPERHILQAELAEKRKQSRAGRVSVTGLGKVWSRCWQLPYCHEAVREKCPAYIARKSCWKFGYGCMCNPKLIEALVRASTGGHTSQAKAREGAYIRSDLEADLHIGQKERTIPCSRCSIFVEHQRQKYKLVNPIVMALVLIGLVVGYGPIMGIYRHFLEAMATLAATMTLSNHVDPAAWFRYLDTPAIRVFFYIIAGVLFLTYVLKSVEWLILHRKLV